MALPNLLLYFFISFLSKVSAIDCDLSTTQLADCQKVCRTLYLGQKNYFNTTSQSCQTTPSCSSNNYYNSNTNTCQNMISSSSNFNNNSNQNQTQTNLNVSLSKDLNQTLFTSLDIVCVNGTAVYINNQKDCICNAGWGDSKNQTNSTTVLKCDVPTANKYIDYNNQSYMNQLFYNLTQATNSNTISSNFFTNLPLVYQILCIGGVFIFLLCCLCGILIYCKYRLKRKLVKDDCREEKHRRHHSHSHAPRFRRYHV